MDAPQLGPKAESMKHSWGFLSSENDLLSSCTNDGILCVCDDEDFPFC